MGNLPSPLFWLLKQNLSLVSPIITRIVNLSLDTGNFPEALKNAIITPILKKPSLDMNVLKNYRPISNIHFIAKVIESIVASRFKDYMAANGLNEPLQSAYRKGHSTETALLKVKGDFLHDLDNGKAVLLVMLDLTAAFDTIDHCTLMCRLNTFLNVSGPPLEWFRSYMSGRQSRVVIENKLLADFTLDCGVPQGSIMGPLTFTMYILPLGQIIRNHDLLFHIYADDSQIYTSYDPKDVTDRVQAIQKIQNCITDIQNWMTRNKLKLNTDKTEFFVIGSAHTLKSQSGLTLNLGSSVIKCANTVRNLGIVMDSTMSMNEQVKGLCRTLNFQIRNISRIRRFLDEDSCHHVVRSLISSRLDYGNSLLAGITNTQITLLQRIQNKAARIIFGVKRREHITPYLNKLHWLPVKQRVNFKILVIMYQCVNGLAPSYLADNIHLYNSPDLKKRDLRSSKDKTRLVVPKTKKVFGDQAYDVIGPRLWNSLPISIREAPTLNSFKKLVKRHLFVN